MFFKEGSSGNWKGMGEVKPCSRVVGEDWFMSPPYRLLAPLVLGGAVVVGEGTTSARREDASFLSLFQIPDEVFHGYDEPDAVAPPGRPMAVLDEESEPHMAPPGSADGVGGNDVVGDMELLAKDPFLARVVGS
jgi:hypothetical protein